MASGRSPTDRRLLAGQIVLVAAVALVGLVPPAEGLMLVLPIRPASGGETVRWAVAAGGRLASRGPYEGAYFMSGRRAPLLAAALRHGALVMRSGASGCSSSTRKQP